MTKKRPLATHKPYSRLNDIPKGSAPETIIPGCLVLEGGAFRGLYTQGLLDAWMEEGLNFQCTIGVSAGALAGLNYVAGQIGRSARANLSSRHNRDYIGAGAVVKSHSLIRLDFLLKDYNNIERLDHLRFLSPDRRYVAVATNCLTGEPSFLERSNCMSLIDAMKASASMPYVTPMVDVDGTPHLDGGVSDPIPYTWAIEQGYGKIIVVKTRDRSFRKPIQEKKHKLGIYRHYPAFESALSNMSENYNKQMDELEKLEKEGKLLLIAPKKPVNVSRVEPDVEKLGKLYWEGYQEGKDYIEEVRKYIES
ncbi:MAG: patatin family protein [Sphaerochaetaceae bacterium]|nr:patatin family protein [Sphaerochaetaceae bacterium]